MRAQARAASAASQAADPAASASVDVGRDNVVAGLAGSPPPGRGEGPPSRSPAPPEAVLAADAFVGELSKDAGMRDAADPAQFLELLSALADALEGGWASPTGSSAAAEAERDAARRKLANAALRLLGAAEGAWDDWSLPECLACGSAAASLGLGPQPQLRGWADRLDSLRPGAAGEEAAEAFYWLARVGFEAHAFRRHFAADADLDALSPRGGQRVLVGLAADAAAEEGVGGVAGQVGALAAAVVSSRGELGDRELLEAAAAVWRLGAAAAPGGEGPGLLETLAAEAEARAPGMAPGQLSEAAHVFSQAGGARPSLWPALSQAVRARLGEFALGQVLRVLNGFVKSGAPDDALLGDVEAWLQRRVTGLEPRGIVAALSAYARVGHAPRTLLQMAGDVAAERAGEFSPAQLTRLLWCYATLRVQHQGLMASACRSAEGRMGEFDGKSMANLLWACASLEWGGCEDMLEGAVARCAEVAREMPAQSLATALWSLAKLEHPPGAFADMACRQAKGSRFRGFEPQSLSMLLWAFATLKDRGLLREDELPRPQFLFATQQEVADRLGQFEGQHLANVMWAYAKLGHQPGRLLREAGDEVSVRISSLKPQEIFMVTWAFSKMKYEHEGLLDAVAGELAVRATAFRHAELVGTIYAYARLGARLPGSTLLVCSEYLAPAVSRLPPKELSILPWSLARMGYLHVPLFTEASNDIATRVNIFNPRQLSMVAWAWGRLSFHPGEALTEVQAEVCRRIINARGFEITTLLWAFATLGEEPQDLLRAVANREVLEEFRGSLPPRNTVEGLWALSATMQYDHPLYAVLSAKAQRIPVRYVFPDEVIMDLAQACAISQWESPEGQIPFPYKLRRLAMYLATKRAQDVGSRSGDAAGRVADVVAQMSRVLGQVGLEHVCWPEVKKTPAPIHLLIRGPGGGEIAVVVEDEEGDYTFGHAQRSGRAAVAQRVLWGAGMDVAPVRATEWRAALDSQEDPKQMMLSLLEDTAQVKAAATAAGLSVNVH